MKGLLIAFEGLDQSGKQTQAELLRDRFVGQGRDVKLLSFPDYDTPIGNEIANALRGDRHYAPDLMQLLYGRNIGQNNNGCVKIPEYDKLYEQTTRMPPSDERDRLYHEMARLIEVYAPWRLDVLTYRNMLVSPRVQGYKKHPILHAEWQFVDIGKPVAGVPSAAGGKAVAD